MTGKTKRLTAILAFLAGFYPSLLRAEGGFDGFNVVNPNASDPTTAEGQAGLMKAASGNQSADGIANGMYNRDTSQIEYTDQQGQVDSRKNAAATAGKSAGTGQAVHAAVGAAMAATATPMLASPIASVRAAGAALMAKAILEFAQSGADSGVKDKNNAQRDLLTQKAGQDNQAKGETAKQGLPPEAQKLLSERGVNPDDFEDRVASGELNSTEDVLRAMGDTGEYSADDLANGDAMANAETAKVFAETKPIDPSMDKLGYDETNPSGSLAGGGVVGGRGATSDLDKLMSQAAGSSGSNHNWAPNNTSASRGKDGEGASGTLAGMASMSAADLLNSLLGGKGAAASPALMADLLARLGIAKANKKQHIFHIAHRNYRSWGKWRAKVLRLVAVHP